MNELAFKKWLCAHDISRKCQSDYISRLKKMERELGYLDLDEQYKNDKCNYLLSVFRNRGDNDEMKKYSTSLPIGKKYIATYKYAIKKYIEYKDNE